MKSTDLNLLPVLEKLIATRSVTSAARELNMSAPTVSRALGRLRDVFNDELLVRSGRRMVLTPMAEQMHPQLQLGLAQLANLGDAARSLTIEHAEQRFRIRCDDIFAGVLTHRLTERVRNTAPKLRLELLSESATSNQDIREGRIDLELGGRAEFPAEVIVRNVGQQHLVALMRKGHSLTKAVITAEALFEHDHVLASVQKAHEKALVEALIPLGLRRKTGIVVPSYYAVGVAVSNSELVATMPAIMGQHLSQMLDLICVKLPVPTPPIQASVAWHSRFRADPIHRWLRTQIVELLTEALNVKDLQR